MQCEITSASEQRNEGEGGGWRILNALVVSFVALAVLVGGTLEARMQDGWIVPQLSVTGLRPAKVIFAPHNRELLLVVNRGGRIDLFEISAPAHPVKVAEVQGNALDAAFSPNGQHIISGGRDGTVRLWTLSGEQVGQPFKGHEDRVLSVAFSPDGQRIVSGGSDGTVRLWTLNGEQVGQPFKGHEGLVSRVAFSPDGRHIVSGGSDGTMRLWTLSGEQVGQPFKGHGSWIWSVAFSPDGQRIVSGGNGGTVRLWRLSGEQVGQPFKGYEYPVSSVAFSPDGQRIISGGRDGTVRLWDIESRNGKITNWGYAAWGLGFTERFFWVGGTDRISVYNSSFRLRGELFLHREGIVALVPGEGVYVPTDRIREPFRMIGEHGDIIWRRGAVPDISLKRTRQILLDDWTVWERLREGVKRFYAAVYTWHDGLGWWKVLLWPVVFWSVAIAMAVMTWTFAPHKLAHWAMPVAGRPKIPTWKWLVGILILFGYLGTTRWPLKAWLRKHHASLYAQNFTNRAPVKERKKYCDLGHKLDIDIFSDNIKARRGGRAWIQWSGGSGKSAVAYEMLRVAEKRGRFLPIVVDEDWNGSLTEHVARLLKVGDRVPTPKMVETLGVCGYLCPLVDSLSERGMNDATDRLASGAHVFKSIVVTSRSEMPIGKTWETFKVISALPLTAEKLPTYVATYASEERCQELIERISPLINESQPMSPLFIRFAIEQAQTMPVTATASLDLVRQYVEKLRAGRLGLGTDDMRRAAEVAAVEAIRQSLVPREIEQEYLRGVLISTADQMAFLNAANDKSIDPAEVIEILVGSGLLNRNPLNRRLQFAYDPVAEYLAADRILNVLPSTDGWELKHRIRESNAAIAYILAEISRREAAEVE